MIVNGQIVSRKSSIMGTNHSFTVIENGVRARYVLNSRLSGMGGVLVDLLRNGRVLLSDVPVKYAIASRGGRNENKENGIAKLKSYEVQDALVEFENALKLDPDDPEIYFHMACAYSVLEKSLEAFECLRQAVEKGLKNTDAILTHDMLAWVRMNEGFEGFLESGFTSFDRRVVE